MLTSINPKLPMRNRAVTKDFYQNQLGFTYMGSDDFPIYLIMQRDAIQIHFFLHEELNPNENYGQVYIRTDYIDQLYETFINTKTTIHPNGHLQTKPWGQKEFAILDPDNNLLTFGQQLL